MRAEIFDRWKVRGQALQSLGFGSYAAYLRSDLWMGIRQKVMHRSRGICEVCGKRPAYTGHHITYCHSVLSGVDLGQVVAICRACHKHIHRKTKKNGVRFVGSARECVGRAKLRTPKGKEGKKKRKLLRTRCRACGEKKRVGRADICLACYRKYRSDVHEVARFKEMARSA